MMSNPRQDLPDDAEKKQLIDERKKMEDQLVFFIMNAGNTAANTATSMRGYTKELLKYGGSPFFTVEFDEAGAAHFINQQKGFLGNHARRNINTIPEFLAIDNPVLKTKEAYINKPFQEEVAKYKDLYLPKISVADTKHYQNVVDDKSIQNSAGNFVIMENPVTGKIEFRYHPGASLNLNNTHHAHLSLGWPVLAAGEATFVNGKLESLKSGVHVKLEMPVDDEGRVKMNLEIMQPSVVDYSGGYNPIDSKIVSYSTGAVIKEASESQQKEKPPLTAEQRERTTNGVISALSAVGVPAGVHLKLEGKSPHPDLFVITKSPLKDAIRSASTVEATPQPLPNLHKRNRTRGKGKIYTGAPSLSLDLNADARSVSSGSSYSQASPQSAALLSPQSRTPKNKNARKKSAASLSPLISVPEHVREPSQFALPGQVESTMSDTVFAALQKNTQGKKLLAAEFSRTFSERSSPIPQRSTLETPVSYFSAASGSVFISFAETPSQTLEKASDAKVSQALPIVTETKNTIQNKETTTAIRTALSITRSAANVIKLQNVNMVGVSEASEQNTEKKAEQAKKKWRWPWSRNTVDVISEPNPQEEASQTNTTTKKRSPI